jgi:hypothetical protein
MVDDPCTPAPPHAPAPPGIPGPRTGFRLRHPVVLTSAVLAVAAAVTGCLLAIRAEPAARTTASRPTAVDCIRAFDASTAPVRLRTLLDTHPAGTPDRALAGGSAILTSACVITIENPGTGAAVEFAEQAGGGFTLDWQGIATALGITPLSWNATVNPDGTLTPRTTTGSLTAQAGATSSPPAVTASKESPAP